MSESAEEHVIYRIATAALRPYPFPHIYVENVFPAAYYGALRRNWPRAGELVPLESTGRVSKGAYPERFVMPLRDRELAMLPGERREFWHALAGWMLASERLRSAVLDKFEPHLGERFGGTLDRAGLSHEVLVLRDHTNYALGPHTDSPSHVISLLFYCPEGHTHADLGTSIYVPVDPAFRCEGGPHYPHENFHKMATMEYRPNTLFAFLKTDRSFHGVDRIGESDVLRDLILYDIQADAMRMSARAVTGARGSGLARRMLKNMLGFKS
jgi:hypothetical protein